MTKYSIEIISWVCKVKGAHIQRVFDMHSYRLSNFNNETVVFLRYRSHPDSTADRIRKPIALVLLKDKIFPLVIENIRISILLDLIDI